VPAGGHTGPRRALPPVRHLAAIDATTFDPPDTAANAEAFGRPPRSGRGEQNVGYAQIRMVGLVECGTHARAAHRPPDRPPETILTIIPTTNPSGSNGHQGLKLPALRLNVPLSFDHLAGRCRAIA
jgi:hypothetical protein